MGNQEIKIPPQNVDAEKSVLGSMLIDEEAIGSTVEILDEVWFYDEANRKIYGAIVNLYASRKNVDLITLSNKLKSNGQLEQVGGATYLSSIIEFVPTSANVEHYAQIVKEKGILRRLIKNATNIINNSYGSSGSIEEAVDNAERLIFEVAEFKQSQKSVHIKELVKEGIEDLDRLYQRKEHITGIATGFTKLDNMTSGLQKSEFVIVAGRPSMGKSALAVSIAEYVGIEQKKRCCYV